MMGFDISTAKPIEEKKGFDLSTAKPIEEKKGFDLSAAKPIQSNAPGMSTMDLLRAHAGTIAKPLANEFRQRGKQFGAGVRTGATMGLSPSQEPVIPELSKFRTAGTVAGGAIPFLAAEAVGGPPLAGMAAARGAGLIRQGIARGVGTGLTLGAAESAIKGEPALAGIKSAGESGLAFGALGGATAGIGIALGTARKYLGEKLATRIAQNFLETGTKVEEKRLIQGKPSGGKLLLDNKKLGTGLEEVYNKSSFHLKVLGNKIDDIIENIPKSQNNAKIQLYDMVQPAFEDAIMMAKVNPQRSESMLNFLDEFIQNNPEILTIKAANQLRSSLDKQVGKSFLAIDDISASVKNSQEIIANTLRNVINNIYPKIAKSNKEMADLLLINKSARHRLAEIRGGKKKYIHGIVNTVARLVDSNLGVARGLKGAFGKELPALSKTSSTIAGSLAVNRNKNE